jgi:hypothetical protein
VPAAARMLTSMARSKALPRLGRLAGDSPTMIFLSGQSRLLLRIAALTQSRASRTDESGQDDSREAAADVAFDLDQVGLGPAQRSRAGCGSRHSAPVRARSGVDGGRRPSRMRRWQPREWAEPTGPGTAITTRPSCLASRATRRPMDSMASVMTVPELSAAMRRHL